MGPAWTDIVRFALGTRLRFAPALPPALRAALVHARPALREWLERLDAAVLIVLSVERDRCALSASTGADAARLGDFTAAPDQDGDYRVRLQWTGASESRVRDFHGVALMLGGERDVYLTQRTEAGLRHLLRWHYDRDGSVIVSIYPAAFASRLPATRALLPTELRIGTLRPIGNPGGA